MPEQLSTEERLERLERAVSRIQRAVGLAAEPDLGAATGEAPPVPAGPTVAAAVAPPRPVAASARPASPAHPASPPRDWWAIGQMWIGRAGLALLALGLAFLFRYAVVRGWLTPELRVGFGLVLGSVLLFVGLRLQATARRVYGLLLTGGGVGIVYLSAYAAFAFYQMVGPEVALVFLAGVTLLATALAGSRREPLLAEVGALGAFAAPLLVRTASPNLLLFSAYVVLVAAWTGGIAARRGWRLLAWTALAGAVMLLILGAQAPGARGALQPLNIAALLTWLGPGAAALWREARVRAAPEGWPRTPTPGWARGWDAERADIDSAVGLVLVGALLFPLYTAAAAHWSMRTGGAALYLGEAAALAGAAWLWRRSARDLALQVGLLAAIPLLLGTIALQLVSYRGMLALEALALFQLGRRLDDVRYRRVGDAVFAFVALAYLVFLGNFHGQATPLAATAADLGAVGAAFVARAWSGSDASRRVYGAGALAGLLAWLLVTLAPLPGGAYWTTLSWGALGTALLLAGFRRAAPDIRAAALATLALVALKLLLVDTAQLPAGGRIIVFLGFGALFLLLAGVYRRSGVRPGATGSQDP